MTDDSLPPQLARDIQEMALDATEAEHTFMQQTAARQREPNHGVTTVDELVELGEPRQAAVTFLRELDEIGCGKFFTGRRGHASRIEWGRYGAIAVAKAFLRAPDELPEEWARHLSSPAMPAEASTSTEQSKRQGAHAHSFLLRPGMTVSVELPLDLTAEEANRLAEFIRAIPF